MISRQLKETAYNRVLNKLMIEARNEPLCPIYEVDIFFNGEKYMLFLQPERHRKIYVLYAVHIGYKENVNGIGYDLITDNAVLFSLTEIFIYQVLNM